MSIDEKRGLFAIIVLVINLVVGCIDCMETPKPSSQSEMLRDALQAESMDDQRVKTIEELCKRTPEVVVKHLSQPRVAYTTPQLAKFSPDGRYVAYFEDLHSSRPCTLTLAIASAFTGIVQRTIAMPAEYLDCFSWSSRGNYILPHGWDHTNKTIGSIIYHTSTGQALRHVMDTIIFSPQDTYYYTPNNIIHTETGRVVYENKSGNALSSPFDFKRKLIFAPNERYVILPYNRVPPSCITGGEFMEPGLVDLCGEKDTFVFTGECPSDVAFTPDSSEVIFTTPPMGSNIIKVINLKTFSCTTFGGFSYIFRIITSPDGQKIGLKQSKKLTIIDRQTNTTQTCANPNGPPNLDWNIEHQDEDGRPIRYDFSPCGTFGLKNTEYDYSPGKLYLVSRDGDKQYVTACIDELEKNDEKQAVDVHEVVPKNGIHPSDMLIMCARRGANCTHVIDLLQFHKLRVKELLAYRVLQNSIKIGRPACQTALEILKESNANFLCNFAHEVQRLQSAEESYPSAASAAAAMTM